jgi:hypothetical protein
MPDLIRHPVYISGFRLRNSRNDGAGDWTLMRWSGIPAKANKKTGSLYLLSRSFMRSLLVN